MGQHEACVGHMSRVSTLFLAVLSPNYLRFWIPKMDELLLDFDP
jgi:hypothetical protein